MRNFLTISLILSAFFIAGCPVPQPQDTPVSQKQFVDKDTGRDYWLYVPSNYNASKPCPLIVSCHGTPPYDISEHHIREWKMLAEKNNCIVVCPWLDGTDGILGDGPSYGMKNSEKVILNIFEELNKKYAIDRKNVLITGFSGGGFPMYYVGLKHPDIFTVIVARSCNFNSNSIDGQYPETSKNIPIFIYWGENDPDTIKNQSRNAIEYFSTRKFKNVETAIVPKIGHDRRPEVAMSFFKSNFK